MQLASRRAVAIHIIAAAERVVAQQRKAAPSRSRGPAPNAKVVERAPERRLQSATKRRTPSGASSSASGPGSSGAMVGTIITLTGGRGAFAATGGATGRGCNGAGGGAASGGGGAASGGGVGAASEAGAGGGGVAARTRAVAH